MRVSLGNSRRVQLPGSSDEILGKGDRQWLAF